MILHGRTRDQGSIRSNFEEQKALADNVLEELEGGGNVSQNQDPTGDDGTPSSLTSMVPSRRFQLDPQQVRSIEMRINRKIRPARVSTAILAGLTACGIGLKTNAVRAAESPQVIKITASRFQFSPNQITLHKDQPVTLQLISTDRTHGFLLRPFKIDTNIEPGKTKTITFTPRAAGIFKAICDHYCGVGHGNMKMTIVVEDPQAKASGRTSLARPTL
jgi:cytochrome c oxidase subunit II